MRAAIAGAAARWQALEALEPRVLFAGDFPIMRVIGPAEPIGGGLTISPNREAVISDTGKVLVNGFVSGTGVVLDNNEAFVLFDGSGVDMVLREGDAIPGTGGRIYTFNDYPYDAVFTGDDVVGFSLLVDSTQPSARGVWASSPGSGGSDITLRSPFTLNTSVDDEQDTGVSATGNVAYYVSGNPSRLFRNDVEVLAGNEALSFGGEDYLLLSIQDAVEEVNASDQFAIDMLIRPAAAFSLIDSVVVFGPGGVVRGVTEFTLDPGIPGVGVTDVSAVDINGAGQVLIKATLQGDVTGATDQALYLWDGDTFTLVVREGDTIPGTSQPLAFTSLLPQFALGGSGQVLTQVNHDFASTVPAIAVWAGGSWQVLAAQGDPAPGAPAGQTFGDLGGAAINDSGTVVFGGSVRNSGGQQVATGLWAVINGQVSNIVLDGDPIPGGVSGNYRLPDSRGLSKQILGTGENGRRTILNDNNRVVFTSLTPGNPTSVNTGAFIANLSGPVQPGAIHGVVWNDFDADGLIALEPGVPDVQVRLENTGGSVIAGPIVTNANGEYRFSNVEPGDYRVRITPPANATFSPTGGDAEIGGGGLSGVISVTEGADIEADAGLILPGPTANLISGFGGGSVDAMGNIDLTPLLAGDQSLLLVVSYTDSDGVDESSLAGTSLSVFRFGSQLPFGVAEFESVFDGDGIDGDVEIVRYRLSPPGAIWTDTALGDFTVLTTTPPAKDVNGTEGEVGELIGLFSIVDGTAPAITNTTIIPQTIGGPMVLDTAVFVSILLDEAFGIDDVTVADGALVVQRDGGAPMPMMAGAFSEPASEAIFRFFAPGGTFDAADEGRYEILTGAAAIKDDAGNAIPAGQVLGAFTVDFTPPTVELSTTDSPVEGQTAFQFDIGWSDNGIGLDLPSLDLAQVRVRRPDGQLLDEPVTRVGHLQYRMEAPGDVWDEIDRGVYTVELANEEAKDTAGNATPVGTVVGTFSFLVQQNDTATNEGRNKVTVQKDSGGLAKLLLKGAQIALEATVETELEKLVGKNEVIINGAKEIVRLVIDPDNPEASLRIAIDLKRDIDAIQDQIPFGAIEALGHMREVVAPGIEIVTDVVFPGLDKLVLGDIADDHTITIGAPDEFGKPYVDITLDRVANTDLISLTPIRTLTVTEWIDDDGDPDVIQAPWIGKIIVKGNKKEGIAGDFEASLDLSGEGAPNGVVLGSATIAGDLRDADWSILGGEAGAIQVKGEVDGFGMGVDGGIKSLKFGDTGFASIVAGGVIKSAQAVRWLDGAIVAPQVDALKLTGDKKLGISGDAGMSLSLEGLLTDKPRLGAVSIAGDVVAGPWRIDGDGKSLTIGDTVFPGVEIYFNGDLASFNAKGGFAGLLTARTMTKFAAFSLTSARVFLGVTTGPNGDIGDDDDQSNFTFLSSFKVTNNVSDSIITLGLAARNGLLFDGDDDFAGGVVKSITIGGDMENDSIFAAGGFPATASINKTKVDPLFDARFRVLVFEA